MDKFDGNKVLERINRRGLDFLEVFEWVEKTPFEEVKKSPKIYDFMLVYSFLFRKLPNQGCEDCTGKAYNNMLKYGKQKIDEYMETLERTLIPKIKNGNYFVTKPKPLHFCWDRLTDNQAIDLLKSGALKEEQFEKLPDGYLLNITNEAKQKRGRKRRTRTKNK